MDAPKEIFLIHGRILTSDLKNRQAFHGSEVGRGEATKSLAVLIF